MSDTIKSDNETINLDDILKLPRILRHQTKGAYKRVKDCWGIRYEACRDPEGTKDIPERFMLAPDFVKVPGEQVARIIRLYFLLCDSRNKVVDSTSEVSVVFARYGDQLQRWRTLVPKQTVGGASVDADLEDLVDIVTGERLKGFEGELAHAGSSHSHNTMKAFFSSTDDKYELDVPGLHVVVGEMDLKRFWCQPYASIVSAHKRHIVDWRDVWEWPEFMAEPHEDAVKQVSKKSYTIWNNTKRDFDDDSGIIRIWPTGDNKCRKCNNRYYHDQGCSVWRDRPGPGDVLPADCEPAKDDDDTGLIKLNEVVEHVEFEVRLRERLKAARKAAIELPAGSCGRVFRLCTAVEDNLDVPALRKLMLDMFEVKS